MGYGFVTGAVMSTIGKRAQSPLDMNWKPSSDIDGIEPAVYTTTIIFGIGLVIYCVILVIVVKFGILIWRWLKQNT